MAYSILATDRFKRESKRLMKKYRSLAAELLMLSDNLKQDPHLGQDLGSGLFKIRLAIKSKGKGKRGGGRVVTYAIDEHKSVYLLTIYDKSEIDTISTEELRELVREVR